MKLLKLRNALISAGLAACCLLSGCKSQSGNTGVVIELEEGDKLVEIDIEGYGIIKAKLFPDIAPNAVDNITQLAESNYYSGLKIHRVLKDMCIQGGSLNGDGTGGESPINNDGVFANEISLDARHFYGALCTVNIDGSNATQFYIVTSKATCDITEYSADLISQKAQEFTNAKTGLAEDDPSLDSLTVQETYYKNLADMIGKADYDTAAKYAAEGGYPMWDGQDTVFGQVIEGFDVLDKLCAAEVTGNSQGELSKPVEDIIINSVKVYEYVPPEPEPEESSSKKKK